MLFTLVDSSVPKPGASILWGRMVQVLLKGNFFDRSYSITLRKSIIFILRMCEYLKILIWSCDLVGAQQGNTWAKFYFIGFIKSVL
jgi:hypothetical protein